MKKTELIKDLEKILNFEEAIVPKLADFYQALGWRSAVGKEYHLRIENGLNVLKEDSKKHARIVEGIINDLKNCDKDEF